MNRLKNCDSIYRRFNFQSFLQDSDVQELFTKVCNIGDFGVYCLSNLGTQGMIILLRILHLLEDSLKTSVDQFFSQGNACTKSGIIEEYLTVVFHSFDVMDVFGILIKHFKMDYFVFEFPFF